MVQVRKRCRAWSLSTSSVCLVGSMSLIMPESNRVALKCYILAQIVLER